MNPDDDCTPAHLAAGWVLGTLSPDEAECFARHLADCASCQAEVASLQEAASAMAEAVPPADLPPGLSGRLMAMVRDEAELFRAAGVQESDLENPRRPRRRGLRSALAAVAVGLVAAGTVLGGWLAGSEDGGGPQSRTISGIVTVAAGGPDARAAIRLRGDDAELVLSDVEAAPDGQIYQAWLERSPSTPVPTGALFSVGPSGDTTISLPPLRGARRMIVTTEAARGSATPTLPPVVIVDLAAAG